MPVDVKCQLKPYIQPFERVLAMREIERLSKSKPEPLDRNGGAALEFVVRTNVPASLLAENLSYWEEVTSVKTVRTRQVEREASAARGSNGYTIADMAATSWSAMDFSGPNRRVLRYGTHGIHEYRGKFFPQLVKALLNCGGVTGGGIVVDPMCGSGTTLAEASLAGITGIGLDLNPLSVLVAKTKCDLLRYPADRLAAGYHKVLKRLSSSARPSGRPWFNSLDGHSQDYLARWFSEKVLDELERVMEVVADANDPAFQSLLTVALSNILRTVSWQKLDDLRVRKEYLPDEYIDPVEEFTAELTRTVRTVLAFRIQEGGGLPSEALVLEGDATIASQTLGNWAGKVSAVITSPPYATALPYLDTDRLSIAYLGLLPRSEHRSRDLSMIGNREITDRYRREYWQTFERNRTGFPGSITTLIRRIHDLNEGTDVGFRRRNLPSLLAKYFLDMKQVLVSIRELLKVGAPAYVVVGSNHTIAGGERVDILTSDLLADLGESVGLELTEKIPMEMLVSRDIFRRNASDSETIVCFRRPQS